MEMPRLETKHEVTGAGPGNKLQHLICGWALGLARDDPQFRNARREGEPSTEPGSMFLNGQFIV